MKIILFIILLSAALSFGQYSNQLISNPTVGVGTGWGLVGSAFVGGTNQLNIVGTGGTGNYFQATCIYSSGDTLKCSYTVTANGLNTSTSAIYTGVSLIFPGSNQIYPASNLTVAEHTITLVANGGDNLWRMRTLTAATSGTLSVDNVYVWKQRGSNYIASTGSNTNLGDVSNPVADPQEALETRGLNTSGAGSFYFADAATYAQNVTVSDYSGSGGFGTISATAAVILSGDWDFGSLTGTVNRTNITFTGTVSNDENITYIDPSTESILQHPEWGGWPGSTDD